MPIQAECGGCHKRFKAKESLAGKKVKCPQCGGVIRVPAPKLAKEDDGDLYGIAGEPQAKAAPKAAPPTPSASGCPSCGGALVENAILCVACGYDLRSGQKLETEHAAEPEAAEPQVTIRRKDWAKEEEVEEKGKGKKKRKRKRRETSQAVAFIRGCAVAFGTGMIGVAISCGVGWLTWGDFGFMSLIIGGLTGTGMMLGYGHEDVIPGIAAAAIAFVNIVISKVLIGIIVFMAMIGGADEFADEMLEEDWQTEEYVDEEYVDEEMVAEEAAEEETLPETQVADPGAEEMIPDVQAVPPVGSFPDEEEEEPIGGMFAVVMAELFASGLLWDILWLLVGCAMAYKVGSGGQWWED